MGTEGGGIGDDRREPQHNRRQVQNAPSATVAAMIESLDREDGEEHDKSINSLRDNRASLLRTNTVKAMVPFWEEAVVDVGSALIASMATAPILMTIDQAITQSAAGVKPLSTAIKDGLKRIVFKPHRVVISAPYWMLVGVTGITYSTANLIDSCCEHFLDRNNPNADLIQSGSKVTITFATHTAAAITKDAAFAKMYSGGSSSAPARPMGFQSIGLLGARNFVTIGAAFTIPSLVSGLLVETGSIKEEGLAQDIAQLITPVCAQVLCTPLHLLALNWYNHPNTSHVAQRMKDILPMLPLSTAARQGRMLAAFGIGGVLNTKLTMTGRDHLMTKYNAWDFQQSVDRRMNRRGTVCDHYPVLAHKFSRSMSLFMEMIDD